MFYLQVIIFAIFYQAFSAPLESTAPSNTTRNHTLPAGTTTNSTTAKITVENPKSTSNSTRNNSTSSAPLSDESKAKIRDIYDKGIQNIINETDTDLQSEEVSDEIQSDAAAEVFTKLHKNGKVECRNIGNTTTVYRIFVRNDGNRTVNGSAGDNLNNTSSKNVTVNKPSTLQSVNATESIGQQLQQADFYSYRQFATVYLEQWMECTMDNLNVTKVSGDLLGDVFSIAQILVNKKEVEQ